MLLFPLSAELQLLALWYAALHLLPPYEAHFRRPSAQYGGLLLTSWRDAGILLLPSWDTELQYSSFLPLYVIDMKLLSSSS